MFDWFFNWLDPKVLRLERWVNRKVVEPWGIDMDLDKVPKGEHIPAEMFSKSVLNREKAGPHIANLAGATLLGYMLGRTQCEAFALLEKNGKLWWRHRDHGTTEDFFGEAFDSMQDFFVFSGGEAEDYWATVLRTVAHLDERGLAKPRYSIVEIPVVIQAARRQQLASSIEAS